MSREAFAADPALVEAGREWLLDCEWPDVDEDEIRELTATQVTSGIARHYAGGLAEFVAAR
jgi:hypothetical protein